jgi:hypothetical protein
MGASMALEVLLVYPGRELDGKARQGKLMISHFMPAEDFTKKKKGTKR